MSDTGAMPNVPQLRLAHIFVFTLAVALVIAIPIANAVSRGTYQQGLASLKPQTAAFFVFDAVAKAYAICGLFALGIHWHKGVAHQAEYLWVLLGIVVAAKLIGAFWPYAPGEVVYLIGGATAAWLSRGTRWKWFYFLVVVSPFIALILALLAPLASSIRYFSIPAIKDIVISSVLIGYIVGTKLTWSAWAGVISQLSLTAVHVAFFLLIFFDLWQ